MIQCAVLVIPLLGTTLGAAMVFFMRGTVNPKIEKLLLGFAAGVMIAASVWSLLIPSIEMAEMQGNVPWVPAVVGFSCGIFFLLALDRVMQRMCACGSEPDEYDNRRSKVMMMAFAVTIHNIPEGMAVGLTYAGAANGSFGVNFAIAMTLSVGIAIQNFPEGAIISMPLKSRGMSRRRAFLFGVLSGVVEPAGALVTILITARVSVFLPYLLSFAAGAMLYVVLEELIPEAQAGKRGSSGTLGAALGFALMMVLDVALG